MMLRLVVSQVNSLLNLTFLVKSFTLKVCSVALSDPENFTFDNALMNVIVEYFLGGYRVYFWRTAILDSKPLYF